MRTRTAIAPHEPGTHRFFLVQRLEARPAHDVSKSGLDGFFRLSYMGSAEFEWNSPSDGLKSLREYNDLVVREFVLTIDAVTRPIFLVGDASTLEAKFADLILWATHPERPFRGQENSYFGHAFAGELPERRKVDAWWSLKDNVGWALDAETAESLRAGFSRHKTETAPKTGLAGIAQRLLAKTARA